jgi:hypothetical protein
MKIICVRRESGVGIDSIAALISLIINTRVSEALIINRIKCRDKTNIAANGYM